MSLKQEAVHYAHLQEWMVRTLCPQGKAGKLGATGGGQRAESGLVDADLGGGVIKQRVARPGKGKSGGYRTLILFRQGDRAIFAFGFAKSAQANISKADLALLRDAAAEALGWNGEELDRLVASGALVEIEDEHED